jgi:hypothetical protein
VRSGLTRVSLIRTSRGVKVTSESVESGVSRCMLTSDNTSSAKSVSKVSTKTVPKTVPKTVRTPLGKRLKWIITGVILGGLILFFRVKNRFKL